MFLFKSGSYFLKNAYNSSRVKNFCVLVKQDSSGKPLFMHKVVEGSAEHSYGIFVAEMAGVSREVVVRARDILCDLELRGLGLEVC